MMRITASFGSTPDQQMVKADLRKQSRVFRHNLKKISTILRLTNIKKTKKKRGIKKNNIGKKIFTHVLRKLIILQGLDLEKLQDLPVDLLPEIIPVIF